eukprot:1976704-Heterocapsa_arctica.AAC.1
MHFAGLIHRNIKFGLSRESLDIEDEDEKNKLEELKAKFEVLIKFTKKVLIDMEYIMKAQVVKDNSMILYMVIKKSIEINKKHFVMSELKKKLAAD